MQENTGFTIIFIFRAFMFCPFFLPFFISFFSLLSFFSFLSFFTYFLSFLLSFFFLLNELLILSKFNFFKFQKVKIVPGIRETIYSMPFDGWILNMWYSVQLRNVIFLQIWWFGMLQKGSKFLHTSSYQKKSFKSSKLQVHVPILYNLQQSISISIGSPCFRRRESLRQNVTA